MQTANKQKFINETNLAKSYKNLFYGRTLPVKSGQERVTWKSVKFSCNGSKTIFLLLLNRTILM